MKITPKLARELIVDVIKAKLVPMLAGSPGTGKSSIIHDIAKEFNLKVIDVRLSQCDPTDLLGFPTISKETGKAHYAPMETFPLDTDEIPAGYAGWLLFLDEFNSAPMSVQAAAYKLVLDREHGQHKLNDKVAIVCAGNLETDQAIVNRMSTAMQSRLVHLELEVSSKEWLEWANDSSIDYRVTSYINFKPEVLYKFSPEHNDKTFACARTWEFVSKLIKNMDQIPDNRVALLGGTISEGVAREFMVFCKIFKSLPTIAQIVANPNGIAIPEEPATLYALTGAIANHAEEKTIEKLMAFINRLPSEFQIITIKGILKRKRELVHTPIFQNWISVNAKLLL